MRNNRLLPYDTIVQATSGEPEAVNTVLQYYSRRIRHAALVDGRTGRQGHRGIHHRNTSESVI